MKKFTIVAVILLGAMTALVWAAFASAIPVVSVAELSQANAGGIEVQIKDGQIREIESLAPLQFTISSRSGLGGTVRVKSPRSVPENFKVGIDVGLRGTYDSKERVFDAYSVTTKCPSRYEDSKQGTPGGEGAAYGAPPAIPGAAPPATPSGTN